MSSTTLDVPGISCAHCKSSIESAVSIIDGVSRVEVAIEARKVDVDYDDATTDLTEIVRAIEDQGYDVRG